MLPLRLGSLLLFVAAPALAQSVTTPPTSGGFSGGNRSNGTYGLTMLEFGITPRAVALGESMGAVEGDPGSIWYNEAGAARIKTNSFLVTGTQRFGDTQMGGAAVNLPTQLATFSIGARAFNAGTIEETENNTVTGGRCRAYQLDLEGGGARELHPHLLIGGSLFYGQETLCQESRGSVGINAGAMFPDIFGRLTLGAGVRNWGTPLLFDQQSNRPPLYGYASGAIDLLKHADLIQSPMLFKGQPLVMDAKLLGQLDFPYQNALYPMLGIEATANGVAIARIGYQWGDDNRQGISLGAGVNVGAFRLEYAFRNRNNAGSSFFSFDPLGDEHHVSATLFWGGPQSNAPVAPVIVTTPIDTAAINDAVRRAMADELARLRPLLDSLRNARVEISNQEALVSQYMVPVHFAFDSADVRQEDISVLGQVAEVIKQVYPTAIVTIEGFADPAGSREYNLRLSERRAEAVKRVMIDHFGLPERQFKTVGYGKESERQVTPGAERNQPGAQENRRVTFTIDATRRF